MSEEKIRRGKEIVEELSAVLRGLSDPEVADVLNPETTHNLLRAILDPTRVKEFSKIADYLWANKWRGAVVALIRHIITTECSFRGTKKGQQRYVSPDFHQWFNDGVVFLEGREPFIGLIGLYRDNQVRYAVAAREIRGGEQVGPSDLEFLSIEDFKKRKTTMPRDSDFASIVDFKKRVSKIPKEQIRDLDKPVHELRALLDQKENDESKYQELLQRYPWILGLQYESIERHSQLDDENIPDFTAVRAHDNYRDIIEVKPPFMKLFRKDGYFASQFHHAWDQIERYLTFSRENKDYLRGKGLEFENPRCSLVLGCDVGARGLKRLREKESHNPAIRIFTYESLIALAENTMKFVRELLGSQPAGRA